MLYPFTTHPVTTTLMLSRNPPVLLMGGAITPSLATTRNGKYAFEMVAINPTMQPPLPSFQLELNKFISSLNLILLELPGPHNRSRWRLRCLSTAKPAPSRKYGPLMPYRVIRGIWSTHAISPDQEIWSP